MGGVATSIGGIGGRYRGAIKWAILAFVFVLGASMFWHRDNVKEIYNSYTSDIQSNPGQTKSQSPRPNVNKTESRMLSLEEVVARQPPLPPNFDPMTELFNLSTSNKFDPAGPRPEQLILLTAADGLHSGNDGHHSDIKDMLERALWNRQDYCDAWGYTCHWSNTSRYDVKPYGPHWKKVPAIIEAFQTYPDAQWVWILDEDAIIMSPEVDQRRLLSHEGLRNHTMTNESIKRTNHFTPNETIPADIDVLIAQEGTMMNSGSIMFRRSEAGRWIIDLWGSRAIRDHSKFSDQKGLMRLMNDSSIARSHLGIVPFRLLQSWAVKSETMGWEVGDLVVHFAGCWVRDHCKESWEKYWKKKGKAPERIYEDLEDETNWWSWLPKWSVEDAQEDTQSS